MYFQRRCSRPLDRVKGVKCDHIGTLTGFYPSQGYPTVLCLVHIQDTEGKMLGFLTNNTDPPTRIIADLYRCRWQVELFFK